MSKVLVLYYSAYGHVEKMAKAVATRARSVAGTEVTIKRVPELVPDEVAKKSGMKLDQPAPVAPTSDAGRRVTLALRSTRLPRFAQAAVRANSFGPACARVTSSQMASGPLTSR
jgi:hypothetical protein